jgi:hypothetical protein
MKRPRRNHTAAYKAKVPLAGPRRFKSDPPCRLNSDPGAGVDRVMVDCG